MARSFTSDSTCSPSSAGNSGRNHGAGALRSATRQAGRLPARGAPGRLRERYCRSWGRGCPWNPFPLDWGAERENRRGCSRRRMASGSAVNSEIDRLPHHVMTSRKPKPRPRRPTSRISDSGPLPSSRRGSASRPPSAQQWARGSCWALEPLAPEGFVVPFSWCPAREPASESAVQRAGD